MSNKGVVLDKKPSGKRVFSFFALVLAFVSAVLLWFYVIGYDSPYYEKNFNVNVELTGESELRSNNGYTVLSDFNLSIQVTVSGKQADVNKLKAGDITAHLDVSGVTSPGRNSLPIVVTVINENGIAVAAQSVSEGVVYIDKSVSAEIPVRIDVVNYQLEDGMSLGDYTVSPVTVTVEGPEAEIAKIGYAYGTVQPGKVSSSADFNTTVSLYDLNGNPVNNSYVTLKDTSVFVSVPVLKTAEIPVKVYFVGGYFTTDTAQIVLSDEYITVSGKAEDVDKISEIKINVMENTIGSSYTVVKNITLPDGVECVSGQTHVTAEIRFNELSQRVVGSSARSTVKIINVPEGLEATVTTANLNVSFMGSYEALLGLSFSSFSGTADLSGMTLVPGEVYLIPVTIQLIDTGDGIPSGIFPCGDYAVTVAIGRKSVAEEG